MAAIDRVGGQWHGVADVISVSGGDQRRGGVEQNYIAAARALAIENGADDGRVLLRVASRDVVKRRALQAKIFWRDFVHAHLTVADFGNFAGAGDGDLVEPIASVDYESTAQSKFAQRLGQLFHQVRGIDADHLRRSARRIGQRSQQVKYGAQLQLTAGRLHVLHGRMHRWGK